MYRLLLAAILWIGFNTNLTAFSTENAAPSFKGEFHSVTTSPGDGTYSLLRRYKLLYDNCNLQKFHEINNLSKDEALKADTEYKLPIMLYTYNGTSIRTTLKMDDLQKAIRIKVYNEEVRKAKLRSQNFIESKILWVPYSELHCGEKNKSTEITTPKIKIDDTVSSSSTSTDKTSTITPEETKPIETKTETKKVISKSSGKTMTIPLFGKKNEKVEIKSNELKNQVYYIVSGHGGPDPGARCTDCDEVLCEDEYAYDVSLRLARNLMEQGATVHVIIQDDDGIREDRILKCDTDEKCLGKLKIPRNQKLRLLQRVTAINDLYKVYEKRGITNQKTISIHIDSNSKNKKMDAYFCYYKNSKSGKKLANNMMDTFAAKYDMYQKDRGYKGRISARNFYVLKNTAAPAVLVELANIKNVNNQKRFIIPGNRQLLADWLYEGVSQVEL
jgi:N-acetylmuramoyl-L-alanine amidase